MILGRVLSAQGRSRAVAGGATVPAALLAEVTDELVAVHGQSDQHRLLRPAEQRAALDRFAGEPFAAAALADYAPVIARWRAVERRLHELRTHAQERARELDVLQFGLDEINAVEPQAGEDEHLKVEEGRLAHAESLARAADQAHRSLVGEGDLDAARTQVAEALGGAARRGRPRPGARRPGRTGPRARHPARRRRRSSWAPTPLASSSIPSGWPTLQERRAALAGLQRKYGPTLDDVLAWADKSAARLGELGNDDESVAALEAEQAELDPRGDAAGAARCRRSAPRRPPGCPGWSTTRSPSCRCRRRASRCRSPPHADAVPGPHGLDDVELLFAANSGTGLRPLHKGASGGELSRLMLALEVVLADRTTVPTLVFDEVDAGIGGKAAVEVGRRLARLAEHAQVIAVTHLPQVAAFADHHFVVSKDDDGTVTSSSVLELDERSRVDELARMLAGQEDSATAQAHARELLELARG